MISTHSQDLLEKVTDQELKAKAFGFYWETIEQLLEQIRNECNEIEEAWASGDKKHLQEEIGDVLLASASLAIFCGMSPTETLKKSIEKFQGRYDALVELVQKDGRKDLKNQSFDLLMDYWKRAKVTVKQVQ